MKRMRRLSKAFFLLLVNLGIVGIVFRWIPLPFIFSSSSPFSAFADPLHILQESAAFRVLPLFLLGTLLAVYAIMGKFFCGWACPFGTFQDLLSRMRVEPPEIMHRVLLSLKYFILVAMVALAFFKRKPLFSLLAPPETLFASIPYMMENGIYVDGVGVVRYLLLFLLVFAFIFVPRFYCRYLCPLSALASPVSKYSLLSLSVSSECDECGECTKVCGMNIVPYTNPTSAECDKCGGCVDACPRDAIRLDFHASFEERGEVPAGRIEEVEGQYLGESVRRHIPKSEGDLEYVPLPLYEKSSEEMRSVLSEGLFEALSATRPKMRYVHFGQVPEILTLIGKYTETKPELIDARSDKSIGEKNPTLYINGKVYPYSLAEEDLIFYLTEERKMAETLHLIVDTSKCRKCLTKKCTECEVFIIDYSSPYDASSVAGIGCTLCGMCMTVCPYDAITVHLGDSQTYTHTSLQHLKQNKSRLGGLGPSFAEVFVKKESPSSDKVLTMMACLSYLTQGRVCFLLVDVEENPLKASQKDVTTVPSLILERERSVGPPSEAGLMLLFLRNERKKR